MAAATFVLACAVVLPKQRSCAIFESRRIDGAKPTTAIALTSSPQICSPSAILGLRADRKWDHVDARSDEQHHWISVIIRRAGGWRIFNSMRNARTRKNIVGAVGLDGRIETDIAVRLWDFKGASTIGGTAAAHDIEFPLRVSGKLGSEKWNR